MNAHSYVSGKPDTHKSIHSPAPMHRNVQPSLEIRDDIRHLGRQLLLHDLRGMEHVIELDAPVEFILQSLRHFLVLLE